MDLPIEVINAVKTTAEPPKVEPTATPKPKARKKKVVKNKKITTRILSAIGRGLRTATAIANDLDADKFAVQNTLWNMKSRGSILGTKKDGKEQKYYLLSEGKEGTPVAKKARKPYTKRVAKVVNVVSKDTYNKDGVNTSNSFNTPPTPKPEHNVPQLLQRLSALELTLVEKEKEVWSLECEVFDKKAVIKYLEEKLFQLGVK
jgi:hypothetical protein